MGGVGAVGGLGADQPMPADHRPLLAVIANVLTPYRLHVHRRITREIPEIRLASLFTHDQPDQPWEKQATPEINPISFGADQPVSKTATREYLRHDWQKATRIIAWLKENNASAVALGGYNDITRLRLIRWCRQAGIPCMLYADSNIHDDHAAGLKRLVKNLYVGWIVRNLAAVMPCGTAGARYFARYGASPDRTFFFPYEPDYDLIARLPDSTIQQTAQDLNLSPDRRRLILCCRLIDVKGVDHAIDAFARIADERPEWDMLIIGEGPLRATLEARVPESLRPRVRWLGFIGEQSRVSAIYRNSDVLVQASHFEPWAVVLNEAAAGGLAIVSSNIVGAAAELVREGVNGHLFPAKNVDALTDALRKTTDPGRIDTLKAGSAAVLADWRRRGDPISGLKHALRAVGVLPTPPAGGLPPAGHATH